MKLIEGKTYLVNLGPKFHNALVEAIYEHELWIFDNTEFVGYSVKPIKIIKDDWDLAKYSIDKLICVDKDQIKELK